MSASTPQSAVAAIVRDYHADADIPRLLARLDAVCAETRDTAALIAAVEPYREMHEVAGPVYERVVEREPENAAALVALANAYWLTGRGPDVVGEIAARAMAAWKAGCGSQPKASITASPGSGAAACGPQGSTCTPSRPPGAIQARASGASTHRRTVSPRAANSADSRQQTPRSPWLSMTVQKMSQRMTPG